MSPAVEGDLAARNQALQRPGIGPAIWKRLLPTDSASILLRANGFLRGRHLSLVFPSIGLIEKVRKSASGFLFKPLRG
jgi:hypothetical protein